MTISASQPHKTSSSAAITIRPATLRDVEAIRRVAEVSWEHTYHDTILPHVRLAFVANSYSDSALRQAIARAKNGQAWFWVAEQNKQVVAFAEVIWRNDSSDTELTRIYLLPELEGQGIGTALLNTALATLRGLSNRLSPPRLWAAVQAENLPAITFYEKRGFQLEREYQVALPAQTLNMRDYSREVTSVKV